MWAKSTNKKDWRGKSKPQIPGGKFVQVKKKCKKFPYCNQGDINALNIFEDKMLINAVNKVSEKFGINKDIIKEIIEVVSETPMFNPNALELARFISKYYHSYFISALRLIMPPGTKTREKC